MIYDRAECMTKSNTSNILNSYNYSLYFNLDSIQLLTLSQKEETLIQAQKYVKKFPFQHHKKVNLSVVAISRPCKPTFVTATLKLALVKNR